LKSKTQPQHVPTQPQHVSTKPQHVPTQHLIIPNEFQNKNVAGLDYGLTHQPVLYDALKPECETE